jgi:hypothetical protein
LPKSDRARLRQQALQAELDLISTDVPFFAKRAKCGGRNRKYSSQWSDGGFFQFHSE